MKENIRLGVILLIITFISGFILGIANNSTADAIAQNSRINIEDLKFLLSSADSVKDSSIKPAAPITEVLEAYSGSELTGYVIKTTGKGFHGDIDMMAAIDKEGKLTGIKILADVETPGVGAKIENPEFQAKFKDKATDESLKVVKTKASAANEIEGISGATISSNAVTAAVNDVVKFYKANIKGEAVTVEKTTIDLKALNIDGDKLSEAEALKDDSVTAVNKVMKGGNLAGYVITSKAQGMDADITVAVAIDISKKVITGIQILDQKETAGVGDQVIEKSFTDEFANKSAMENKVSVDAISGATVSSDGVMEAVGKALTYFNSKLKG